jgi:hypothetical protein
MKDSHRTTQAFMNLKKIVKDKISVFVNQTQLYPYFKMVNGSLDGTMASRLSDGDAEAG